MLNELASVPHSQSPHGIRTTSAAPHTLQQIRSPWGTPRPHFVLDIQPCCVHPTSIAPTNTAIIHTLLDIDPSNILAAMKQTVVDHLNPTTPNTLFKIRTVGTALTLKQNITKVLFLRCLP